MSEHHHKSCGVSPKARRQRVVLLFAACVARIVSLTAQGLWRDEVDQWRFALQPWPELWARFTQIGWNGPLFSPLLRIWIELTGDSAFAMRYFSLVWGMLSVALVYVLACRLMGHRAAGIGVLLVGWSPYMVWYAQEIKMYSWVPMLVLLGLYALDKACANNHIHWWLVFLSTVLLLFYSHILGPLFIPIALVWVLLHFGRNPRVWLGMLIVLVFLTVLSIPLLRWQAPLLLQERQTGYPRHTFGEMVLALLSGWSAGLYQAGWMQGHLSIYAMLLVASLALMGVLALFVQRRFRIVVMLLTWLVLPVLALWLISLRSPIFTDRYMIWSAPAFYLLAGAGITLMGKVERWLPPLCLTLVLGFNVMGLFAQAAYPIKPQFSEAIAYARAHRSSDALLLFQVPYNHYVVAYYDADFLDPWAEAPFTNWRLEDGAYQVGEDYVDAEMRAIVAGYSDLWLVYSEFTLWDERELVKAWLDGHGALVDQRHFQGVSLYHYMLTQ